jgi:hypothetical protein
MRSYASGVRRFLGLVERDGFGGLAAARAAPDRLLHIFQSAKAELTLRRRAGPALRDVVTGRHPAETDPEIGAAHIGGISPAPPGRRYAIARTAPSGTDTVTGSQTGKMAHLSPASRG